MIYRFLRTLAYISVRVFFRRIEVEGTENVPGSGPVLLVPNHPNALVDALMVVISVKRPVSITAKSTLADIPIMRQVLKRTRVILFHRKVDISEGADPSKNVDSITQCRERLELGEAILIFPEGQSHSEPSLRPLRSGAARIALHYVDAGLDPGLYAGEMSGNLAIVPVGLHFPEKDRFRSDVWVRFGKPIDAGQWAMDHHDGDSHDLTREIGERIRELTLNFERRPDSLLLMWAAEILETGALPPARVGIDSHRVSRRLKLVQFLNEGYQKLKEEQAEAVSELRRRILTYRLELRKLGIKPSEVYLRMPAWRVVRFIIRELTILAIGLPIAAWGALNHLIPVALVRTAALTISKEKAHYASIVILPTVIVIPVFYAVQITAAWFWLTPVWTLLYAVSLPVTGFFTVLYHDRVGNIMDRARTFILFLRDPDLRERLGREGREIIEELRKLGEKLEKEST